MVIGSAMRCRSGKSTWTLSHCAWKPAKRPVMVWNVWRMVQPFPETEVGEVVGAQFVAQERRELFILLEKRVFEVGAKDMMAMLDLIDDGGELAAVPAVKARAKDHGDLVGGEPPEAEFAAALEQLADGKVALENEVAAILDLGDGIEA